MLVIERAIVSLGSSGPSRPAAHRVAGRSRFGGVIPDCREPKGILTHGDGENGGPTVERSTALLLIAVALGGYGLYHAFYAITMLLARPASLLLLLAFALQAVLAILAAVGVWRRQRWAGSTLLLLGATIAATALIEAFVLGIIAWLHALLIAVAAILIALLLAVYVSQRASFE